MSRLINADKFKDQVAAMMIAHNYPPVKAIALTELIDKQPTVFDVDKVTDQLKKEESKARLELMENRKTALEFSSKCRLDAYKKSLEIVEGGVV